MILEVRSPFDGHAIGDLIADEKLAAEVLADHRATFVVRVAEPAAMPVPEQEG